MYMYFVRLIVFVGGIFVMNTAQAQVKERDPGFGIEANLMAGKIVKHSAKFHAPIPPLSTAADVNFTWQTYGKKEWHQRCNFPLIGVGVTYTDYGNDAVLGRCVGVYPNIQIPLYRNPKMEWTLRIGNGLGYVTKKYQDQSPTDTLNNAIGSYLNDFAIFMTDVRLHVNDHWHLQMGANFTHISNAHYRLTNLGINMVGAHVGVQYYPTSCRTKPIIRNLPKLPNRWLLQMRAGIAFTESRAPGSAEVPTYLGSIYASRRWRSKNKMFAGIDYGYHKNVYAFLQWCNLHAGNEAAHSWDGGVFIGNELMIGRLGIVTQAGVYYKQTYLAFDPLYEKIGGNYYLLKREHGPIKEFFLSAMLTTHAIVAEYADFGIGFGF
jgi:hypothetical protein